MNQYAKRRQAMKQREPVPAPVPQVSAPVPPPAERRPITSEAYDLAVEVGAESAGERLDRFLASHPAAVEALLSRSRLQALIGAGAVAIDGAVALEPGQRLKAGQHIGVAIPAAAPAEPEPEAIPLDIVFEDADLIVIDKPAGLVVHPAAGHASGTLVNALIAHCGASLSGINGVRRPGIVHRLDKETSGLLVVAKTDAAHQGLAALFADHGRTLSLTREYLAFVWGVPDRAQGTVDAPIGRHRTDRLKQAVVGEEQGREAITHWRLEETYAAPVTSAPLASLLRCSLETGRTHQIRVHMAHVGHPLLGDRVYGSGFKTKAALLGPEARAALDHLGRQALHAAVLGFTHPVTGAELLFESALPAELLALKEALRERR